MTPRYFIHNSPGSPSQWFTQKQELVLDPSPYQGPTGSRFERMSSQELSGLMRTTMSHFGIRTVFSKEVIWLLFPIKESFTLLLTGESKFVIFKKEPGRPLVLWTISKRSRLSILLLADNILFVISMSFDDSC